MSTRPVVIRDHGYLDLPGVSGAYASTPNDPSLQLLGDLDLRCEFFQIAPTGSTTLLGKWDDAGNQRSYRITTVSTFGFNGIVWTVTGGPGPDGLHSHLTDAVPLNPGAYRATKQTVGPDTLVRHYLAPTLDHPWTLHKEEVVPGTSTVFNSSAGLYVGAINSGTFQFFNGRIYRAQVRSAVDGPIVADADFRRLASGTTSFVDAVGRTWTVNGAATVVGGQDFVTL